MRSTARGPSGMDASSRQVNPPAVSEVLSASRSMAIALPPSSGTATDLDLARVAVHDDRLDGGRSAENRPACRDVGSYDALAATSGVVNRSSMAGDAAALESTSQFANRVKCALLV